MTVTYAKKPTRCDACGLMVYTGQLVSTLSGVAHVDCEHPNAHRSRAGQPQPVAETPEPTFTTEPSGIPGVVRLRTGGHVAEGILSPCGPDSFQFSGRMVCGPHDADGVHLVAANQEGMTMTDRLGGEVPVSPAVGGSLLADHSGPGAGQPIRNSSTERES